MKDKLTECMSSFYFDNALDDLLELIDEEVKDDNLHKKLVSKVEDVQREAEHLFDRGYRLANCLDNINYEIEDLD